MSYVVKATPSFSSSYANRSRSRVVFGVWPEAEEAIICSQTSSSLGAKSRNLFAWSLRSRSCFLPASRSAMSPVMQIVAARAKAPTHTANFSPSSRKPTLTHRATAHPMAPLICTPRWEKTALAVFASHSNCRESSIPHGNGPHALKKVHNHRIDDRRSPRVTGKAEGGGAAESAAIIEEWRVAGCCPQTWLAQEGVVVRARVGRRPEYPYPTIRNPLLRDGHGTGTMGRSATRPARNLGLGLNWRRDFPHHDRQFLRSSGYQMK